MKYLPETFVLTKNNPVKKSSLYWDLVYFLDKNIPYTRVNKYSQDSYLYEFTGEIEKAEWNHACKIQDVIKDSIARYDFLSVWNKQKDFNSNFFDFNVQDIELQQKLTKEFVLHIEDEAHELLREVNWKMGQYKIKDVDRARLLEEWIDVFKYWLGLGNVWGFTLEDFVNEFWRKSSVVDERFKQYFKDKKVKKEDDKTRG